MWSLGRGQFWPQGYNLNNFGNGPLGEATVHTKYQRLGPSGFREEDF